MIYCWTMTTFNLTYFVFTLHVNNQTVQFLIYNHKYSVLQNTKINKTLTHFNYTRRYILAILKVILYSYLILKKMNERITDS